jgi:hypothetical protein
MHRFKVLWEAIKKWWKDEPPPLPANDNSDFLKTASKTLEQYDDCFCRRLNISPEMSGQAASRILEEGHKRPATTESEVRLLSITVERILRYLQVEDLQRREAAYAVRKQYPLHSKIKQWKKVDLKNETE